MALGLILGHLSLKWQDVRAYLCTRAFTTRHNEIWRRSSNASGFDEDLNESQLSNLALLSYRQEPVYSFLLTTK